MTRDETQQREMCKKWGAPYFPVRPNQKVGVSENLGNDVFPINGLRHNPNESTSGWYIWGGQFSDGADFFKPLHAEHLDEWCPIVRKYLGLAPGWRFLIAPDYEDVWFDPSLLID